MYQVVREITKGTYELFYTVETLEQAKIYQKFIKAFLGYETKILEAQEWQNKKGKGSGYARNNF